MRRRQTSIIGDNLGLLLDAICNTFGAVLLIAILVAIILNTSVKNVLPTEEEIKRARQLRSIEIKLVTLESEKQSLIHIINLPTPTGPSDINDIETIRLTAKLSALRKNIKDNDKVLKQKAAIRVAGIKQRREFFLKQKSLTEDLAKIQDELEIEQKKRTKPATFPLLSSDFQKASQVILLVRYDRLYLSHRTTRAGRVVNLEHMFINKLPNGDTEARAKPNAGIDLQSPNAEKKVELVLKDYNPGLHSFGVLFGPESHESYDKIASILKKNNFYFFPWPIDHFGVWDRGGKPQPPQ
jgi:transposase